MVIIDIPRQLVNSDVSVEFTAMLERLSVTQSHLCCRSTPRTVPFVPVYVLIMDGVGEAVRFAQTEIVSLQ